MMPVRLLGVVLAVAILLAAGRARASRAVIELDFEAGDVPSAMCIVSRSAASDTFVDVGRLVRLLTIEPAIKTTWGFTVPEEKDVVAFRRKLSEDDVRWVVQKDSEGNRTLKNVLKNFYERSRSSDACGSPSSHCAPAVWLNARALGRRMQEGDAEDSFDELGVTCVDNRALVDKEVVRPVFIFVDFHSFTKDRFVPRLTFPYFDGNVGSVELDVSQGQPSDKEKKGPKGPEYFFTVRVLGGDYLHSERVAVSYPDGDNAKVRVPITRRCRERNVRLPSLWTGKTQFTTSVGGSCLSRVIADVSPIGGTSLVVPNGVAARVKTLVAQPIVAGAPSPDRAAIARWTDERAPAEIETHRTKVSFSWRIDSLYFSEAERPILKCPSAELVQVGVSCAPVDNDGSLCRYVCGRTDGAEFNLPTVVQFRRRDSESDVWTQLVARDEDEVAGYLPSEQRFIDLRFDDWGTRAREPADEIDAVDVSIAGGPSYRIPPVSTRLSVPGLRDGATLAYKFHGDRWFYERRILIKSERVPIKMPEEPLPDSSDSTTQTLRWLTFEVSASTGYGISMSVGKVSGRAGDGWFYGALLGGLRFRPRGWAIAFDVASGVMLSEREYFGVARPRDARRAGEHSAYARVPIQVGVSHHTHSRFAWGGGGGVLLGYGLGAGVERVGGVDASPFIYLGARFRIFDAVWLSYEPRVHFTEPLYVHDIAAVDGTASPTVYRRPSWVPLAVSLRAELGIF